MLYNVDKLWYALCSSSTDEELTKDQKENAQKIEKFALFHINFNREQIAALNSGVMTGKREQVRGAIETSKKDAQKLLDCPSYEAFLKRQTRA
jgi:hypothetical protein